MPEFRILYNVLINSNTQAQTQCIFHFDSEKGRRITVYPSPHSYNLLLPILVSEKLI